ncbi:TasA family protein (plasmid) [Halobacterium sp. MBLA0001]|uniref:TasA family protein n=1 Tax=Halobacterium sp. MBLA0001 TaxID=3413511 RepID=UPI003C75207A
MTDKTISITRRRALIALGTIGAGGAAAGAGTFAAFSDTASTTGDLSAGTLDISSDTDLSFNTAEDIVPGDSGSASVTLTKSGDVAGNLSIEVTGIESSNGDSGDGSLDEQIELQLWIDASGGGGDSVDTNDVGLNSDSTFTDVGSKGTADFASNFSSATWDAPDSGEPSYFRDFSGGVDFVVEYEFVDDSDSSVSFDNDDVQGHDLTVDFQFTLTQQQ